MAAVGLGVELNAQKIQPFANAFAHHRRVLADAPGEYQRVHAAKRRGKRANPFLHLIAKQRQRLRRARIAGLAR